MACQSRVKFSVHGGTTLDWGLFFNMIYLLDRGTLFSLTKYVGNFLIKGRIVQELLDLSNWMQKTQGFRAAERLFCSLCMACLKKN